MSLAALFLQNGGILSEFSAKNSDCAVVFIGSSVEAAFKAFSDFRIPHLRAVCLSPINYNPYKNIDLMLYEVGFDEVILALLANGLRLESKIIKELDVGLLSGECNLGEEELESICANKNLQIILGSDLDKHRAVENIARILALISKSGVRVGFLDNGRQSAECGVQMAESQILPLSDFVDYDGLVVYLRNTEYGIRDTESGWQSVELRASKQFLQVLKRQDKEEVEFEFIDIKQKFKAKIKLDENLKGMVGILSGVSLEAYCYQRVKVA